MLGNKTGLLLVVAVISFSMTSEIFADDIFLNFDKAEYNTGDLLTLSGFIEGFSMPIVAVSVYDPDGKILSANNLELDENGNFSKIISLDSPFYDNPGNYKVKIDYRQISLEEFFTIGGDFSEPDSILDEEIKSEIILLTTEKEMYTDGETVTITGFVSSIESPTVLIGIYDPFGTPAGFYFGDVDSNLEFTTSFLAKAGVNFKIDGMYSIKAHYADMEVVTVFEFYKDLPGSSDDNSNSSDDNSNSSDDNSNSSDDNSNSSDDNSNSSDDNSNSSDDNSNSSDDNSNSSDDNSNSSDDNSNSSDDNSNSSDDNSNSSDDNSNSSDDNSNSSDDNSITDKNSKVESIEPKEEQSNTNLSETKAPRETDNLSVEDIELGKLLNQINLECDKSKYSDSISYYDGMGPALYRLCNFDSSLQFFSESLAQDPYNVEVLTNKGSALGKLGYYSDAILHYNKALAVDSNFLPALNNKANTLATIGNYDEAVSLYAEALGKNPSYSTARQNLESVLSEMPQKNNLVMQNQVSSINESNSILSSSIDKTDKIKLQKESSPDFFEKVDSMFSSIVSLFGISS